MRTILLLAVAISCLSGARELNAQARFGPQLSVGSSADFGLGARAQINLRSPDRLAIIPMFDWFFPGGDRTYWELNGNLAYFFKVNTNMGTPSASSRRPVPAPTTRCTRLRGTRPIARARSTPLASSCTVTTWSIGSTGNCRCPTSSDHPTGRLGWPAASSARCRCTVAPGAATLPCRITATRSGSAPSGSGARTSHRPTDRSRRASISSR